MAKRVAFISVCISTKTIPFMYVGIVHLNLLFILIILLVPPPNRDKEKEDKPDGAAPLGLVLRNLSVL